MNGIPYRRWRNLAARVDPLAVGFAVSLVLHLLALFVLPLRPPAGAGSALPPGLAVTRVDFRPPALSPSDELTEGQDADGEPPARDADDSGAEASAVVEAAPQASGGEAGLSPPGVGTALLEPYYARDQVDRPAQVVGMPVLKLPDEVVARRIEGRVEAAVFISAEGSVDKVEILASTHPGLLDDAAIEALMATRYTPARRAERDVRSVRRVAVAFTAQKRLDRPPVPVAPQ